LFISGLVLFAACAFLVQAANALLNPLTPEQVDEAYSIGRDVDHRGKFFDQYVHTPSAQPTGPDVHLIEFETPFEQVALRSQEHWANSDRLEAERDYAANPSQVIVRVFICGSQTFSFPQPLSSKSATAPWQDKDYLRGFVFRVSQTQPIQPDKFIMRRSNLGCPESDAVEAFLYFDTQQLAAGNVKVEVTAPGGQTFATDFDLDRLK
jgi:hypothetical protein